MTKNFSKNWFNKAFCKWQNFLLKSDWNFLKKRHSNFLHFLNISDSVAVAIHTSEDDLRRPILYRSQGFCLILRICPESISIILQFVSQIAKNTICLKKLVSICHLSPSGLAAVLFLKTGKRQNGFAGETAKRQKRQKKPAKTAKRQTANFFP